MRWMIALISVAAMLLGFIPVSAVDRFIIRWNRGKRTGNDSWSLSVLVFGRSETADRLEKQLAGKKADYCRAGNEGEISSIRKYSIIFILDSDDAQNLLMCDRLEDSFPEAKQILLCNDRTYLKLFEKSGKKFFLKDDAEVIPQMIECI